MTNQYESLAFHYVEARKDPVTRFLEAPSVTAALGDVVGRSVIDFACGAGHYTRLVKDLGAGEVLGVDLSAAMIEAARIEEKRNPRQIAYVVGDASRPSVFGSFEIATAAFLFNYADDLATLENMFATVAANLKDGGRLVAVVPNPDFVNGRGDTAKYDFLLHAIEKRPANLRVRMDFLAPEFSIEFTQWDRASYETAMQRCGYDEIGWIPFAVSPEGVADKGEDFWAALLANPKSIVLRARKRGAA